MALVAPALLLLMAAASLVAPPARAADFTVNPIQIFLSGQTQSAILTIQNTSTEPLRFQLNAFGWAQDAAGQMQLTPTSEVIFFPRLLTLAPNEQRIVRVGASGPPGPVERTYRIFVEELPPSTQQAAPPGQVRVLARMGIPIFVEARAGARRAAPGPPDGAGWPRGLRAAQRRHQAPGAAGHPAARPGRGGGHGMGADPGRLVRPRG